MYNVIEFFRAISIRYFEVNTEDIMHKIKQYQGKSEIAQIAMGWAHSLTKHISDWRVTIVRCQRTLRKNMIIIK